MLSKEDKRSLLVQTVLGAAATALFVIAMVTDGDAHEATSVAGQPHGWAYPSSCCSGLDCGPVPATAVKESPDGYRVTILPGQHPMVTTRPFTTVIPYKVARDAPDGDFHLCIRGEAYVDAQRFLCFYAGAKGF